MNGRVFNPTREAGNMGIGYGIATAALTALFGVCVLVIGQIIQRFFLEPIQEQRKAIGEIAYNLTFLANVGSLAHVQHEGTRISSAADPVEAAQTLRKLASHLRASLNTIPFYDALASVSHMPKRSSVLKASSGLIGWANSIFGGERSPHREWIAEALNIDIKS